MSTHKRKRNSSENASNNNIDVKAHIEEKISLINETIKNYDFGNEPAELYDPIKYTMELGGKRVRPLLSILSFELFHHKLDKILLPAIGIEVFHNFTLIHDDIMDESPLRRGKPTVQAKWGKNTAILAGDVTLVKAYDLFLQAESVKVKSIISKFNKCAAQICEGQQLDMLFEDRSYVTEDEYILMVEGKTASLLGFSLELGAIIADAPESDCEHLKKFGIYFGIGFQIKDDLLDVYGDQKTLGKKIGGDILANKKTYPLIKALESAQGSLKKELEEWLLVRTYSDEEHEQKKIHAVISIYNQLSIKRITEEKIKEYFAKAFTELDLLSVRDERKYYLKAFAQSLSNRVK